ncbi:MAG TPA: zinc ribbon domain-containing protein [Bryobacteraceae bacterium]|nr:zinc ribbon domain-containing protein [Bryobacteraceae bacterium]
MPIEGQRSGCPGQKAAEYNDLRLSSQIGFGPKSEGVMFCTQCGASLEEAGQFCAICGARVSARAYVPALPGYRASYQPSRVQPPVSGKGFSQVYGLDPRVAFLTLVIDLMLNAGDIATMGLLVPFSIAAGIVLGYVSYKAQMNWYGDDHESAKIKAIILGLLTAIPTPLPAILYIPSGVLGLYHSFRRKLSRTA